MLIDAVALLDIFKQNSITDIITIGDKTIRQHVYDAPTIDAVPVVRCKDCVYANSKYSDNFILCDIWGEDMPRDGYCYCGKRMGGEAE